MQRSESSLNSLGFLKDFRDLPLPLLLESVFLAANASSVLFITCQVLAHVLASDCTPVCDPESSDVLVELEALTFLAVLVPPDAFVLSNRINGVHSRCFRCGSTKSTLDPDGFPTTNLSWAMEFLKSTSNLDCMAPELSVCSLLIVSILVSSFQLFTHGVVSHLHFHHIYLDIFLSFFVGRFYFVRHLQQLLFRRPCQDK